MEDDSGALASVRPPVGRDGVLLAVERLPDDDHGVLDDGGGVAEDEVDSAADDAASVELAVGLGVEGVLVAFHPAVKEDGAVGLHPQCHCLALDCTGGVPEPNCLCYESLPNCRCNQSHI